MARKKSAARRPRDPFPEDALRDLERALVGGIPPIVVLRGEERYFRDRGVALVTDAAKAAGMEICRHDALDPEYSVATLTDDLVTGALFQSARCIIVHGAERIVVPRASKHSSAAVEAMVARLDGGAEGSLVLSAEKLRADHALIKEAQARGGLVVGCRRLYESPPAWDPDPRKAELSQWCAARARALGVPVDLGEAAYIAAATGNDLAAIDDQLKRLVGRGREAIQDLIAWDASASPWEVAEHIVAGEIKRGALGIETLFSGGASQRDGSRVIDAPGIVAQLCVALSSKLREAVRAAAFMQSGLDPARAVAAAGIRGPKAQKDAFERRLASRPPEQWAGMLEQLGDVERRSRSSVKVDATDFVHLALQWRRRATIRR